ncbi:MAG: hypothetical protein ACRC4M_02695 [Mycoplasma sp.]
MSCEIKNHHKEKLKYLFKNKTNKKLIKILKQYDCCCNLEELIWFDDIYINDKVFDPTIVLELKTINKEYISCYEFWDIVKFKNNEEWENDIQKSFKINNNWENDIEEILKEYNRKDSN